MKLFGLIYSTLVGYSPPAWAAAVAGVFVAISVSLSMFLLFQHLSAYKNPEEQKFLVGVILMVPCYAFESTWSLKRPLRTTYTMVFGFWKIDLVVKANIEEHLYHGLWILKIGLRIVHFTVFVQHGIQAGIITCVYVSLVNPSLSVDCGIIRDSYESFAMYCFGRYLVACLGGEERTIEFMNRQGGSDSNQPLLHHLSQKGIIKHHFPMNYFLKPWRLGEWFYQIIKIGIVQYMIIKTVTAILAVFLEAFNAYCDGEFKWDCGYPYMAVVLNFSQSWALYCLVQFYAATKDELEHISPLAKFLTFKSIVFLTWWQGVAIALLYSLGLVKSPIAQALQFKSSIQDFIICIEMGIASIVHLYVFPAKPYELMGERFPGTVSVLGDYASVDCPLDPDEVRDSERPTKLRIPQPSDDDFKSGMNIKESVRDVFIGGGEYIVNDLKFTVTHAVEPMEKGFTKFNEKLLKISQNIKKHEKEKRRSKDDSCIRSSSPTRRIIRGIDDPLLNGAVIDNGASRGRRHRRKSGYTSAESGGESSSERGLSGFEVRGLRWITRE